MKTFWLFMVILGFSGVLVNFTAFDLNGHWSHVAWALYSACFAGYGARKLSTYE